MTTAVKNKWQTTLKRLEILPKDKFIGDDGISYLKLSGSVKSNLRVAVHYLGRLDERDEEYKVPFDREKFEWLLSEPVGKVKLNESLEIMHKCAEMARRSA